MHQALFLIAGLWQRKTKDPCLYVFYSEGEMNNKKDKKTERLGCELARSAKQDRGKDAVC